MPVFTRIPFVFAVLSGLVACGGGGSSAPPQPSVTVTGNAGEYWQDQPVDIRFSTSNMDASSVSYSVTGAYTPGDFILDSSSGTFKAVDGIYTDAGNYSLTVTATDGSGKSASRSFQFDIDAVLTGFYTVEEPFPSTGALRRVMFVDLSRDGGAYTEILFFTDGGSRDNAFACFGEAIPSGADFTATLQCEGAFPTSLGSTGILTGVGEIGEAFETVDVDRVSFSGNINDDTVTVEFYDEAGALVEAWSDSYYRTLNIGDAGGFWAWPTNGDLVGRYVLLAANIQYEGQPFISNFGRYLSVVTPLIGGQADLSTVRQVNQFDINDTFNITPVVSRNGASNCQISGQISQISLDEYQSVFNGGKGGFWQDSHRILSSEYRGVDCELKTFDNELLPSTEDQVIDISQNGARILIDARQYDTSTDLIFAGGTPPIKFYATKICNAQGNRTQLAVDLDLDCL